MIYPFFLTSSQYKISISKIWCTLLHISGLNTSNEGSDHTYLHMIGRNTPEQWTTDHGLITPTHDSSDNMYLHLIGLNTPTVPTHDWSEHIYLLMIDWTHLISHNWSKHNHLPGLGIRSFAHSLILLKSNILTKKSKILISMFYIGFFVYKNEQFVHSLIFGERCERIPQVAHQKWANEQITRFYEQMAHSLIFLQKTSFLLSKPMSEFPALPPTQGGLNTPT